TKIAFSVQSAGSRTESAAQLGDAQLEERHERLAARQDSVGLEKLLLLRRREVDQLTEHVDEGGVVDAREAARVERACRAGQREAQQLREQVDRVRAQPLERHAVAHFVEGIVE